MSDSIERETFVFSSPADAAAPVEVESRISGSDHFEYKHIVKNRLSRSRSGEKSLMEDDHLIEHQRSGDSPLPRRPPSIPWSAVEGMPMPSPEMDIERLLFTDHSRVSAVGGTGVSSKRRLQRSPNDGASPPAKAVDCSRAVVISDESENETPIRPAVPGEAAAAVPRLLYGESTPAGSRNSGNLKVVRYKKEKKQTMELPDLSFDDLPDIEWEERSSVDIAGAALEWLNDLDVMRAKSGNIQGRISGHMKIRIFKIKEAIETLSARAEARGDLGYLRKANETLTLDSRDFKRRLEALKVECAYAKERAEELRSEVQTLKESGPPSGGRPRRPGVGRAVQTSPDLVPTLSPARGKKDSGHCPTNVYLANYMKMIHEIDGKIAGMALSLEDLRRGVGSCERDSRISTRLDRMREDPVSGLSDFGAYLSSDGGAGPQIVNNIQLVPPRRKKDRGRSDPVSERDGGGDLHPWTLVERSRRGTGGRLTVPSSDIGRRLNSPAPRGELSLPTVEERSGPLGGPSYADHLRASFPHRRDSAPESVRGPPLSAPRRRPARPAAVMIRPAPGGSVAEVLHMAKSAVSLEEIGICDTRLRRSASGGLLIEIPGPDGPRRADILAQQLRTALGDAAVVTRPMTRADCRLVGLDDTVSPQEIAEAVASLGECLPSDLRVSPIRLLRSGFGVAWVQCPLSALNRLMELGRIRIGWSSVRVESLGVRPTQCFRCWEFGHVRDTCKSAVDRSGHCFGCGEPNHNIRDCRSELRCVICRDRGLSHSHRLGSAICAARRNPLTQRLPPRNSGLEEPIDVPEQ